MPTPPIQNPNRPRSNIPRPDVPFVDPQTGVINPVWYRYLNAPVSAITAGVPNGGTGLSEGISGGVLGFTSTTTLASSAALAAGALVKGGGPGATPASLARGAVSQVLHGAPSGDPTWGPVNLSSEVSGTLPIVRGGTGATTATGGGSVVLNLGPTLIQPSMLAPILELASFSSPFLWFGTPFPEQAHFNAIDLNVVSVTGSVTTLVDFDFSTFFVCHDKTSGGMAVGVMDGTVGAVTIVNTIVGVTFSRGVGVGLRAQVTAGVNPRSISTFSLVFSTI